MTTIAAFAVLVSAATYCYLAMRVRKENGQTFSILPHAKSSPHVATVSDFSSTTVATALSLATVLIAVFDLFSSLHLWLLWTVLTTYGGLMVVKVLASRMWTIISRYGVRPTLHGYLGDRLRSPILARTAAIFSVLGFLGAFGVEVTVGSKFLTLFLPIGNWLFWVAIVALVVLLPLVIGGYRALVVSERYQLFGIYIALMALSIAVFMPLVGSDLQLTKFTAATWFPLRADVVPFLVGIFFINIPSFVVDMSLWQRIAATKNESIVLVGLKKSARDTGLLWAWIIAIAAVAFVCGSSGELSPLANVISFLMIGASPWRGILVFAIIIGLLAALVSTAWTQIIASTQAITADVLRIAPERQTDNLARVVLVAVGIPVILLMVFLEQNGLTVADLVFAIYGSQLSLVPIVCACLFFRDETIEKCRTGASVSIIAGFITGWTAAVAGRFCDLPNLTFLAPLASLVVSALILIVSGLTNERSTVAQNH